MLNFAGILRSPDAAPLSEAAHAVQAAARAMRRSPNLPIRQIQAGALWLMVQGVQPARIQSDFLGGSSASDVTAVVGDPVVDCDDQSTVLERSVDFVSDALLAGHPSALKAANGTFAAVAWNARTKRLTLATDKIGGRGLYFKKEAGALLFATSLRLLRAMAEEPERLDEQGFAEGLFLGQPLGERTHFRSMRVLRPGEFLTCDGGAEVTRGTYADHAGVSRSNLSFDDAVGAIHQTFKRAVQRRLFANRQEAFLSGGMDSRAVVAALVDLGQQVRTFCTSFKGSLDDVVSQQVAARMGTQHLAWHRTAAERIRYALDPFAMYARDHFPPEADVVQSPRRLWSGDGGSVTMGHVYLTEAAVQLGAGPIDGDIVRRLFPSLSRRPTRQVSARRAAEWSDLATEGAVEELKALAHAPPDRRLFHFYMRNDQAKHLFHHFESIDRSEVELLTPFFDGDLVSLVSSLPIEFFMNHKLYNEWIKCFSCGAGDLYWQPYRGHLPSPHAPPEAIPDQWDQAWYAGPEVRASRQESLRGILSSSHPALDHYVDRRMLRVLGWLSRMGSSRYDYEFSYAQNVHQLLQMD